MSVFIGGPYGRLAIMLNTLSSLNIEIIIIIIRGRGLEPHSGRRVVSLSKTYLPPKSTGNTQEAVAPSKHD